MITREWFVFTRERFVITTGGVCLQHNVGDYNKLFVIATEGWRMQQVCGNNRGFVLTTGGCEYNRTFVITTEGW